MLLLQSHGQSHQPRPYSLAVHLHTANTRLTHKTTPNHRIAPYAPLAAEKAACRDAPFRCRGRGYRPRCSRRPGWMRWRRCPYVPLSPFGRFGSLPFSAVWPSCLLSVSYCPGEPLRLMLIVQNSWGAIAAPDPARLCLALTRPTRDKAITLPLFAIPQQV